MGFRYPDISYTSAALVQNESVRINEAPLFLYTCTCVCNMNKYTPIVVSKGTAWENWTCLGAIASCIPVLFFIKENYNRLEVDEIKKI